MLNSKFIEILQTHLHKGIRHSNDRDYRTAEQEEFVYDCHMVGKTFLFRYFMARICGQE